MSEVSGSASSTSAGAGSQDALPAGGALGGLGRLVANLSSARDGGAYQGAFSYAAEWHSFAVGFGAGYVGDRAMQQAVLAYGLGRGGGKRLKNDAAHIKDVADEPAYAIGGIVAGRAARGGDLTLDALGGLGVA